MTDAYPDFFKFSVSLPKCYLLFVELKVHMLLLTHYQ